MQDFERARFEKAVIGFQGAFDKGYTRGDKELNDGAPRVADIETDVKVPRNDVHAGEWQRHLPEFEGAGRDAALAKQRLSESRSKLLAPIPDDRELRNENLYRWVVSLNPRP